MFVVLEGFSGTGKTTLARGLEGMGWLRLAESAHAVPDIVPVAERADTAADYSLLGATLVNCSVVSRLRRDRKIVSEGYLLSDLAYAKIRQELGKSAAYPSMMAAVKSVLGEEGLRPDLYLLLVAKDDTIVARQQNKNDRERNPTGFFRERYYSALAEIHGELGEGRVERVLTDTDPSVTLGEVIAAMKRRGLAV